MWGPGAQGGFQNALMMGLQVGQMAGQAKRERDERNALSAYVKDPSQANFGGLADVRPDIAINVQGQQQAAQAKQMEAQLVQRAMGGDDEALGQLATVNFDKWKTLDGQIKAKATEEAQVFGNAALDLLNMPYEARRGQVVAYAQQFPEFAEQINNLAFLPPAEQDAALRGVVADAKMIDKLIQMERPSYQAVGVDQDLVNVRDPEALRQFDASRGRGGQQAMPSISDIDAELRRRGVIR